MGLIPADRLAKMRAQAAATLPQLCDLQTVNNSTGARTTVAAGVACRVAEARGAQGPEWFGDQRLVRVFLPVGTAGVGTADLVLVSGGSAYRVVSTDPLRSEATLRSLSCVESREAGGPV